MRRRAKVDNNQNEIVEALRGIGATVQPIHQIGQGCPDVLVGYKGRSYVLEIKDGKDRLTIDETIWHATWKGAVSVVRSVDEALAAIGIEAV